MSTCSGCGKPVASEKFCRACGTPTLLGRRTLIDEERFASLTDALIDSYATPPRRSWTLSRKTVSWLAVAACLAIAVFVGLLAVRELQARSLDSDAGSQAPLPLPSPIIALTTPVPRTPRPAKPASKPTPSPSPSPASPSPSPTASPSPSPSPTRTPKPGAPASTGSSDVVKSNGALSVGAVGSCSGNDVTVAVGAFPRGCTIFGATVTGPLADRKGTALMVPVSSTGSRDDVDYALLYVRIHGWKKPAFIGVLSGDGSGHLAVRLENGLIVEQNGPNVKRSRFDGSRVVPIDQ